MTMTGELCRAARAALQMSNSELANAAGVGVNTISRFEQGSDLRVSNAQAIQAALEARGVVFTAAGQVATVNSVGVAAGE